MTATAMESFADSMKKFQEPEEKEQFLCMGYGPLNKILSGTYTGGFLYGRVAEIFGPAASGKTVLATLAMKQAQLAGGMAVFIDWECAFSERFAEEIGLNTKFPYFHKITPETFEEGIDKAFEFVEQIRKQAPISKDAPIVMVFDSIAAAVPRSKMYDAKGMFKASSDITMNDKLALANATSQHLPRVAQMARRFNAVVILLNQLRERPGVTHGDPNYTPGGRTPEFVATTRLQVGASKLMEVVPGGKEFIGRLIKFTTVKSKSTRPFQTTEMRLTYGEDGMAKFDYTLGLIEHLAEIGKIAKDGKMCVWDGKRYYASVLAEKIDKEGKFEELAKLLHS